MINESVSGKILVHENIIFLTYDVQTVKEIHMEELVNEFLEQPRSRNLVDVVDVNLVAKDFLYNLL